MSDEHTPGPWELAWEDGKHGVIADAAGGKLVCIVGNNPNDGLNDIRKANATLIASAPEMKRTIAELLTVLQSAYLKHHLNHPGIGWDELDDTLQNVLCETMGDAEFVAWLDGVVEELDG